MRRSNRQCEVMIKVGRVWTRCGRSPVQDHHLLTRARGGSVLDAVGETYHHLACCPYHHAMVDDLGFESGLLIAGSAYHSASDKVVYVGPDEYLTAKYPPVLQQAV